MIKKLLYSLFIILFLSTATYGIIAYSQGYRPDFKNKQIKTTGILAVSSYPEGASVVIDGKLTSATNASISLEPGFYEVKITKEGYLPWEKKVKIQGEIVSSISVLLVAANPSLKALTVNGVTNPVLSMSGNKVAYVITEETSTASGMIKTLTGIWVFDLRSGPLGQRNDTRQIYKSADINSLKNASILWSPDEKQIIYTTKTQSLQLSTDSDNAIATNVTSVLPTVTKEWSDDVSIKNKNQIAVLPLQLSKILTNNTKNISFSPDETKILYQATSSASIPTIINPPMIGTNSTAQNRILAKNSYYIYDLKEDKNFLIGDDKMIPLTSSILWYSDSKHLIFIEKGAISIIDYDSTNKRNFYSGPFEDNIVYPSPQGGKIVILTNLNKPSTIPNLYEVDLR